MHEALFFGHLSFILSGATSGMQQPDTAGRAIKVERQDGAMLPEQSFSLAGLRKAFFVSGECALPTNQTLKPAVSGMPQGPTLARNWVAGNFSVESTTTH